MRIFIPKPSTDWRNNLYGWLNQEKFLDSNILLVYVFFEQFGYFNGPNGYQ